VPYFLSNVGGDVVRLVMMHPLGSSAQVAASIFVERWTGFVVLLGLSILSLLLRPQYFLVGNLLFVLWLLIFVFAAAIILPFIVGKHINKFLVRFSQKEGVLLGNIAKKLNKFFMALNYFREKKREIVLNLLLSVLFYCVIIVFQYFILVSVGSRLPLQEVCLIAPLIPLVSLLPISPNGLGLAEGAFVVFYTQAGVSPEVALAASVLRRVLSVLVSLVGGVWWLMEQAKPPLRASHFVVFVRRLGGRR
jgi:glycosyltransferase 2 family protein